MIVNRLPMIGEKYKYYGVTLEIDNAGGVRYTGDSVGMQAGWDNWKNTPIFKRIRPCVVKDGAVQYYLDPDNLAHKADGTSATIASRSAGDVMIEIPKIGYKMTTDGTCHYIYLTDDPNAEGYCYRAHSLDSEGDCDYIYIGAYLGYVYSSMLYSISGKSVKDSTTLTDFRTYATARGTGYQLVSFYPLTLLQCMYLMIYKNKNSQVALGYGYVGGSAKISTGHANAKGMNYGNTSSQTDTAGMCFLGIEDFWGNCLWWIDGIYSDTNRKILTAFKSFNDTGSGYPYDKVSDATGTGYNLYMKDIEGTNEGGFVFKRSFTAPNPESHFYGDVATLYKSSCACFGGKWDDGYYAGAFRLLINNGAGTTLSGLGARLMYKHKA